MDNKRARLIMTDLTHYVADLFGDPPSALTGKSRNRMYTLPRVVAVGLAVRFYGLSLVQAGKYMGARHHTTAMYYLKQFDQLLNDGSQISSFIMQAKENYDRMLEVRERTRQQLGGGLQS